MCEQRQRAEPPLGARVPERDRAPERVVEDLPESQDDRAGERRSSRRCGPRERAWKPRRVAHRSPPSLARLSTAHRSPRPPGLTATPARAGRPAPRGPREQARVQRDDEIEPRRQAIATREAPAETRRRRGPATQLAVGQRARRPSRPRSRRVARCGSIDHAPRLARLTHRELDFRRRLRGHQVRAVRRRHREDHDQPPGSAQRVPPGDADRGLRRAGARRARTRRSA